MPRKRRLKLEYGKTVFDLMSREELLLFAKRAYSALSCSRGALHSARHPNHPFWGPGGTGGDALLKVEWTLDTLHLPRDGAEQMWRRYYRNASPALFEGANHPDGTPLYEPWWACDVCEQYVGGTRRYGNPDPTHCQFCEREGRGVYPVRKLTLADVEGWRETKASAALATKRSES